MQLFQKASSFYEDNLKHCFLQKVQFLGLAYLLKSEYLWSVI